jgi:hypothetical protein
MGVGPGDGGGVAIYEGPLLTAGLRETSCSATVPRERGGLTLRCVKSRAPPGRSNMPETAQNPSGGRGSRSQSREANLLERKPSFAHSWSREDVRSAVQGASSSTDDVPVFRREVRVFLYLHRGQHAAVTPRELHKLLCHLLVGHPPRELAKSVQANRKR